MITLTAYLLLLLPSAGSAQTPEWVLTRELRIGSIDDERYSLTEIGALAVGADGTLYVAQSKDGNLRVFDPQGRFLDVLGRRGSGPGEFQEITNIGWKGDSLWVVDFIQHRVSFFDPQGTLLHTTRIAGPLLEYSSRPTAPEALLGTAVLGAPLTGNRTDIAEVPILRLDHDGHLLGEAARIRIAGEFKHVRAGGFNVNIRLPVQSNTLWSVTPDSRHLVLVDRPIAQNAEVGRFLVHKLSESGDTVFSRRFRYTPKRVPAAAADSIRARYVEFWSRAMNRSDAQQLARDSIPFPQFQAPVTRILPGADGRVWLQREVLGHRAVEWLILRPNGQILARVAAPPGTVILYASGSVVWGVEKDELEVPYLVRYGLSGG